MLCATCVLPDGLEVEQQSVEVNQPPRVVSQDPDPAESNPGLELPFDTSSPGKTIRVRLADPNFRDSLSIRMFVDYSMGNVQVWRNVSSPATTSSSVPRAIVEFTNLHCSDFGIVEPSAGTGGMGAGGAGVKPPVHLLELIVSDRGFDDAGGAMPVNRRVSADGFGTAAYWTFTCKESP